jgi:hypothetical protein
LARIIAPTAGEIVYRQVGGGEIDLVGATGKRSRGMGRRIVSGVGGLDGKAEEEFDAEPSGDDDNAASQDARAREPGDFPFRATSKSDADAAGSRSLRRWN